MPPEDGPVCLHIAIRGKQMPQLTDDLAQDMLMRKRMFKEQYNFFEDY